MYIIHSWIHSMSITIVKKYVAVRATVYIIHSWSQSMRSDSCKSYIRTVHAQAMKEALELAAYVHVQYASKKNSHKRTVQRGARSRSAPVQPPFKPRARPVQLPFSSRSSPVCYNWLSRSCFCAVCAFFALLNF